VRCLFAESLSSDCKHSRSFDSERVAICIAPCTCSSCIMQYSSARLISRLLYVFLLSSSVRYADCQAAPSTDRLNPADVSVAKRSSMLPFSLSRCFCLLVDLVQAYLGEFSIFVLANYGSTLNSTPSMPQFRLDCTWSACSACWR